MSDIKTGYRALPQTISNPKNFVNLSTEEFNKIEKTEIQSACSVCTGHEGTTIWYSKLGYIVQVKTTHKGHFFIVSPCTIAPTIGMDYIDGLFAEDAEEYILSIKLGYKTDRLDVFGEKDNIDIKTYLEKRGVIQKDNVIPAQTKNLKEKKWWQFW